MKKKSVINNFGFGSQFEGRIADYAIENHKNQDVKGLCEQTKEEFLILLPRTPATPSTIEGELARSGMAMPEPENTSSRETGLGNKANRLTNTILQLKLSHQ